MSCACTYAYAYDMHMHMYMCYVWCGHVLYVYVYMCYVCGVVMCYMYMCIYVLCVVWCRAASWLPTERMHPAARESSSAELEWLPTKTTSHVWCERLPCAYI